MTRSIASPLLLAVVLASLGCIRKDNSAESTNDAGRGPSSSGEAERPIARRSSASKDMGAPDANLAAVLVPAASQNLKSACTEICQHSQRLKCKHSEECIPNCLGMGALTPCSKNATELYRCLTGQPAQNWECAPDGVAAIRDGFCEREQSEMVACMEARMQP